MLWCGGGEVASLPSVFARIASLLAPHAEPNPVARSTRWGGGARGKEGGARRGHLGIPSATWLRLRLFHSGSRRQAITDDRPWWQGREAPQTSRMTRRPANNRTALKMMCSVTWLSPKRLREEGTAGGRWCKIDNAGLQASCRLLVMCVKTWAGTQQTLVKIIHLSTSNTLLDKVIWVSGKPLSKEWRDVSMWNTNRTVTWHSFRCVSSSSCFSSLKNGSVRQTRKTSDPEGRSCVINPHLKWRYPSNVLVSTMSEGKKCPRWCCNSVILHYLQLTWATKS